MTAALESRLQGVQHRSRIQALVDAILPAVGNIDPGLGTAAQLRQAVEANVRWTVRQVRSSPEFQARMREGTTMKLVAAIYDIETGRVRLLDEGD